LEREPETLDEALQISFKLEVYDFVDPARNDHSVGLCLPEIVIVSFVLCMAILRTKNLLKLKVNPVCDDQQGMIIYV
jgi:hypothetical protein